MVRSGAPVGEVGFVHGGGLVPTITADLDCAVTEQPDIDDALGAVGVVS